MPRRADLNHILVIGAYGMTRFVDWTDKRTCTLFGDGAGAVVVSAGDRAGFLGGNIKSDGAFHDYMGVFIGGTAAPTGGADSSPQKLEIRKRFPPDTNNKGWPPLVRALMEKIGQPVSAIDKIYFTEETEDDDANCANGNNFQNGKKLFDGIRETMGIIKTIVFKYKMGDGAV